MRQKRKFSRHLVNLLSPQQLKTLCFVMILQPFDLRLCGHDTYVMTLRPFDLRPCGHASYVLTFWPFDPRPCDNATYVLIFWPFDLLTFWPQALRSCYLCKDLLTFRPQALRSCLLCVDLLAFWPQALRSWPAAESVWPEHTDTEILPRHQVFTEASTLWIEFFIISWVIKKSCLALATMFSESVITNCN